MSFFHKKLAIDLGTSSTLVYIPKKGIVIDEPTVVAVSLIDREILAVGQRAKDMLGKTPENVIASCPIRDGSIADYRATRATLHYFIKKIVNLKLFQPEIIISIPVGSSSTEKRAIIDATIKAGAKVAYIVKEPILAAIGAGISIIESRGRMIVNIGGGVTEATIISLGGIVSWDSVKIGGRKMDESIIDYIKEKYNLIIGHQTAEKAKIEVGSAMPLSSGDEPEVEIKGRDMQTGMPRSIIIKTNEIAESLADDLKEIGQTIKNVLRQTPPELSADVMTYGIILTGGGCLLRNIAHLISKMTGVPCVVADEPRFCVVKGAGIALEHMDVYRRSLITNKRM
ncbi:MAG TPA: rod shape-determining protein [Candidatus Portnoybacteria bacterium]|nr:rod shape-determining protein [Candidatus Portnoybacteria bacterium]